MKKKFTAVVFCGALMCLQPSHASNLSWFSIPKMTQKLADRRVQSAKNRLSQRGLYWLDTTPFATVDFWQLSIPSIGQLLSHLGYKRTVVFATAELDDLEREKIALANIEEPSRRLAYAAKWGNLEVVKITLANPETNINYQLSRVSGRDDFGPTALMEAARGGHKEIVELLLNAEADPNILDPSEIIKSEYRSINNTIFENGETALMWAAERGHKEIVELLLNAKADPNIQDLCGNTALMAACRRGHTEVVKVLLYNGAKPNIKRNREDIDSYPQNDWTALMFAANNGHKEIVKLLLDAGADSTIKDRNGKTAAIPAGL